MLVSIGDRESDIYELFLEATREPGPALLVRAEKTRNRKVGREFLRDAMARKDVAGSLRIHIPRRGSQPARDALLTIRCAEVTLRPPHGNTFPPVTVWAVYVRNEEIEWMLLTTAPVTTFDDAQKRVEWYSGRWGIEVYHCTLKSGCRIKDRQLEMAGRLEACLGMDMVVAWRIYYLTMLGRETPDTSLYRVPQSRRVESTLLLCEQDTDCARHAALHTQSRIHDCNDGRSSGEKRRRLSRHPNALAWSGATLHGNRDVCYLYRAILSSSSTVRPMIPLCWCG
jgi:hypothetical protein